jgi:uncharacterized protein YjbI with pentapeptide repeats
MPMNKHTEQRTILQWLGCMMFGHRVGNVPEQVNHLPPPVQRPSSDDRSAWRAYWKASNQPWRTEPEIDKKRQIYLAERRRITPDIQHGMYPFKSVKLSRADVEWLLATHQNGHGPIIWNDEGQHVKLRDGLDLRGADVRQIDLHGLPLARLLGGLALDDWSNATAEQRDMAGLLMQGATLKRTHLEGASLRAAHLEEADLFRAHLEKSHLMGAHLGKTSLIEAYLDHASFSTAMLYDGKHIGPRLADVHWGDINLAVVEWSQVKMLGDEYEARQKRTREGTRKEKERQLEEYRAAMRANRQLAVILQDQGMIEEGARFGYRARAVQRELLWRRALWEKTRPRLVVAGMLLGAYVFSLFFDLLAGYGYKPHRSVIAYLVIIFGFMSLYLLNAHFVAPHLTWDEALVLSVSSFHGRGFFTQNITLGDTYARLAAVEAIVGLIVEISFIATFTQRYFGR